MCRKWSSEDVYKYGDEVDVCEDGEGGDRREFERRSGCVCGGGYVEGGDRDVCEQGKRMWQELGCVWRCIWG